MGLVCCDIKVIEIILVFRCMQLEESMSPGNKSLKT